MGGITLSSNILKLKSMLENLLKNSEKIAYVRQLLMYPIKKKKYLTTLDLFLNAIMFLGFNIKNCRF